VRARGAEAGNLSRLRAHRDLRAARGGARRAGARCRASRRLLDPASTDQAVAQKRLDIQNALNWETRIFDDRSRLLPAVCDQPVLLEQRLYQLSHAVMDEMGS